MIYQLICVFFLCAHINVFACAHDEKKIDAYTQPPPYTQPITCPDEAWFACQPYFLPENHVLKKKLDLIFSKKGVLKSVKSASKVGFLNPHPRESTQVVVTKHPKIPGYIIKAYLDSFEINEWEKWLVRIKGANLVQSDLDNFDYNHLLKVPKKWIYPLPPESVSDVEVNVFPKHFVLIAQDVGVMSKDASIYSWKHLMMPELLTALYTIVSKNRMYDSIRLENIPFCFDKKIAFVDTEQYFIHRTPKFWKWYKYLSSDMEDFFRQLING